MIVNWFEVYPMVFPFKKKGFPHKYLCSCVWLLISIANICDNIIWYSTSGIRAKISVEVMAGEEGKTSRIEKFDGTNFGY